MKEELGGLLPLDSFSRRFGFNRADLRRRRLPGRGSKRSSASSASRAADDRAQQLMSVLRAPILALPVRIVQLMEDDGPSNGVVDREGRGDITTTASGRRGRLRSDPVAHRELAVGRRCGQIPLDAGETDACTMANLRTVPSRNRAGRGSGALPVCVDCNPAGAARI